MTRRTLTGMGKGGSRSRRVKRVAGIATLSGMTLAAGCSSGGSEPVEVTQQGACASITYEAENIVHSTGGPTAGGWNIWTNGYIGTSHSFVGGMTIVTVNASGTVAAGQWPHLVLSVGGVVIGSATVDTTSFAPYVFQASIPAGVKELRVAFDNDYLANGQDRNLLVDRLTIACAGPTGMGGSGGNAGASGGPSGVAGAAGNSAGGSGGNAGNAGTSGAGSAGVSGETVSGSAALKYQTDWGSGYCADVTVSNTSAISATTWTLGINLNQAKMSSAWNGQFSANSGAVSVTPADFNRALAPGASASFGFCANATGSNYRPTLGKLSLIANNGGGTGGGGGGNAGNDNQGGGGNAGNDNQGGGGTGGAGSAGAGSAGGGFGGAGSEGGASGSNGAGAGGTAAGGGAGGYTPSTGGYAIKSSFLNNPNLAVAHALSTADFYAKAADPQFGGFFTYLDRQGRATGSNKSFVVQSRDAYAFVRAFMVSGDERYLDLARQALSFLYAHGWDAKYEGFIFMGNQQGAAQPDPSGAQSPKWSFVQHYGLVGVNAMCEATRGAPDCGWLDKGIASLNQHLWDARSGFQGYYNNANLDFTSPRDKGFTPTIDGITTHALNDYLVTGRADYRERFFWLADNATDHLAANMSAPGVVFGFPEDYDSNWRINSGSKFGFVGHVYKTAWCLARAYLLDPQSKYRTAARQILLQMYEKGGFDRVNGAPNYSFNWDSGVTSTDKEYWQLEQAILSGLYNYAISNSDADRAIFLEVADRTLDFYVKHLFDTQFGGIFYQTNATGSSLVRSDKGDQWEGAYHDVELSYYLYVDGNLLLWHRPITLYYRFEPSSVDRDLILSPIPLRDARLAIDTVSHAGAVYPSFDGPTRSVHLPANTSGVFAVTFKYVDP